MRHPVKTLLLLAALAVVLAPIQARADGFIEPWVGPSWGSNIDNGRAAVGLSAGALGKVAGVEFDLGFSPRFFGPISDFGSNSVVTAMGDLVIGAPIGNPEGRYFRPYAVGGIGLLRTQIEKPNGTIFDTVASNNDLGWNMGAGLMGYVSRHVGLRGDVRYLRSTDDHGSAGNNFHFWRVGMGLTFR